jgi:RNA polymerase sigma-70 factor (ECF subfamily)
MTREIGRSPSSDAQLVKQSLAGESGAFDALVNRHFGVVWTIAFARLGQREAAEDLVQEVFVRAYLRLRSLREPSRFVAWICRVARNLATDWARRGQTRSAIMPLIPLDESVERTVRHPDQDPRQIAADEQERASVRAAIARLPPEQREVVLLHFVDGLSMRDIADNLGVAPSTVSRQLARATRELRGALEPVLRESLAPLRARPALGVTTAALVAAVAGSSQVKAAVVSAVGKTVPSAAGLAAEAGLIGSLKGLLGGLSALAGTGGKIVATHKSVAAVVAVVATVGGVSVYRGTQPRPAGLLDIAVAERSVHVDEAGRIELTEPVRFSLAPLQGDSWRQTTRLQGHVLEKELRHADREYDLDMRVVSEARVSAGGTPAEVTVDHLIREVTIDVDAPHLHELVRAEIQKEYDDRAAKLGQAVIRETLDTQGRRIRVHATIEPINTLFGVPFEPAVLAMLSTPTGTGGKPLQTGVTWDHDHPMPFLRDRPLTTSSTLDQVGLIDGERVAVIRGESEFHLDEIARGGLELGTVRTAGGHTGRCILWHLDFSWTQDSTHRLSDGHRLLATGRMVHDMAAEWVMPGPGGAERRLPYEIRIEYEFVTETDHRT